MKIGIAGAGGIGSNIAVNLVRSGIDNLKLVDMDRVEQSNLNRQFYFADQIGRKKVDALAENLCRICPTLSVDTVYTRITRENCRELFADCALLVEGLDGAAEKKMLLELVAPQVSCLVSASGIGGRELAAISSRRLGNCVIVGDFTSDCRDNLLYSHKLQAVCAHMTEILLEEITR